MIQITSWCDLRFKLYGEPESIVYAELQTDAQTRWSTYAYFALVERNKANNKKMIQLLNTKNTKNNIWDVPDALAWNILDSNSIYDEFDTDNNAPLVSWPWLDAIKHNFHFSQYRRIM